MISRTKIRQSIAVVLGVVGVVGIAYKAGVAIPLLTGLVGLVFRSAVRVASGLMASPTVFLSQVELFQEHLIWCVSATWLGIAAWLWNTRDNTTEGFWKIISWYCIFMTLVISSTVFALSYHWDPLFLVKFYASSFALGLILGFSVGRLWSLAWSYSAK